MSLAMSLRSLADDSQTAHNSAEANPSTGDVVSADAGLGNAPAPPSASSSASAPGPEPGQVLLETKSGLELVWIPGGSVQIGCVNGDRKCATWEKPTRAAKIDGFWMGKTDVSVAAYEKCVQAGNCTVPNHAVDVCNWGRRKDHPINCEDWNQAKQFCEWIGARLPTAEEWEYAAKSGEDRIHPWGNEKLTGKRANYCDIQCPKALLPKNRELWEQNHWIDTHEDDGWASTSPVGAYPQGSTRWGLLDMVGNVWQWTASDYDPQNKEIRGGSWLDEPSWLRTSARLKHSTSTRHIDIGFRCVR
jgi:formylglycine-generating enzyme required for sulfatase activity